MNVLIKKAMDEFSAAQSKYSNVGACDSEVYYALNAVLRSACQGQEVNWSRFDRNGWDLYDSHPDHKTACDELTSKARVLHETILKEARPADLNELRGYFEG